MFHDSKFNESLLLWTVVNLYDRVLKQYCKINFSRLKKFEMTLEVTE
jgi:hypothetical protein